MKKKRLKKREFSLDEIPIAYLKKGIKTEVFHPEKEFQNHRQLGDAIFYSLIENDTEAFTEILDACLRISKRSVSAAYKSNA